MSLDLGDVPAWIMILVSLWFSVTAWRMSRRGLGYQEISAEAAVRSAEAAERSALAAERSLRMSVQDIDQAASGVVAWQLESPKKNLYVLRNVGSIVATGVTLDEEATGGVVKSPPRDAVVRPGESVTFLMIGSWQHPVPGQLWVSWDGSDGVVAVPVPSQ